MINNLSSFGKFLDQPMLIAKLNKSMPKILFSLGGLYLAKNSYDLFEKTKKSSDEEKSRAKKEILKKIIILTSTISSAILAPKFASILTKRTLLENIEQVKEKNTKLINAFLNTTPQNAKNKYILNKAKTKVLSFNEIKLLFSSLNSLKEKVFLKKLIPDPENIKAKDIFQEIGYLSIYGAIPVIGGILGGIGADIYNKENLKEKIPDKINEGLYQYLANIFMCNIGAGSALAVLEKLNITSKTARGIGMMTGIVLTGVLGGSKIANFITKNLISPLINPKIKKEEIKNRKPELLDLGLHIDDIATVSLLSGLKWIEPSLPILYTISGYKAGMGYRN